MDLENLSFHLSAIIDHLEQIEWEGDLIDILQEIVIEIELDLI